MKKVFVSIASACCLMFFSCAPQVGQTIEAPQIPPISTKESARARFGSYVALTSVVDTRTALREDEQTQFTEPFGGAAENVEQGLKTALNNAGISVVDSAPINIKVEIRRWRTQINSKTTVGLNSEATLFVELLDPAGKRVFSGTYNGTRNSQFPVVTRVDVKDSLALAMGNAIEQVISDSQLIEVLSSY